MTSVHEIAADLLAAYRTYVHAADLADRSARRVFGGAVSSPAYAQRCATRLEYAAGDLDRAVSAAGYDDIEAFERALIAAGLDIAPAGR